MRYPAEHKESVRARIVETASRALRKSGLDGVSIPSLMKKAGLTHGGFYAHFSDRDELVAEAVRFASEETGQRVFEEQPDVAAMLDAYLSPMHAAHPEHGCVIAALGADAPRQSAPIRKAFGRATLGLLRLVHRKLGGTGSEPNEVALARASQMVGAVVLARATDDPKLAARILRAAHRH